MIYDVVVVGGSIGGVLAAKKASQLGKKVVLIEKTKWIGGQFTNQAVPPDEHPFIEEFGATQSYMAFREDIRSYMKTNLPVKNHVLSNSRWNPGHATVSRLSAPPKIFLKHFEKMLEPYLNKQLTLFLNHSLVSAEVTNHVIKSIEIINQDTNEKSIIIGHVFIDATDTGELLPLSKTKFKVGRESKFETNEPNAGETEDSQDIQPVTWVAALEYCEGESHIIEKPSEYAYFKAKFWPCEDDKPILSFYGPDSSTGKTKEFIMFDGDQPNKFSLWSYRRIIDPRDFEDGFYPNEVTLINWPQNDYIFGNLFDDPNSEYHQYMSKQLTLSLIYWLQTEAIKKDGSVGYAGLKLRGDILGTEDGLAQSPYIRESRRIISQKTITEHHMNANIINQMSEIDDSVGVGAYHIDLHMTTRAHRFFYFNTWPFQIPLSSMIPIETKNLIPGCKNIGTTQLTNGCFRLHPVEWNIGEVAGILASTILDWKCSLKSMLEDEKLQKFQSILDSHGIERAWPIEKIRVI